MKEHKKLYKAGKLWVTATLFIVAGITLTTTNVSANNNQATSDLTVNSSNSYNSVNTLVQSEDQVSNNIQDLQNQVDNAQNKVDQAQQSVNDAQDKVNQQQTVVNSAKNNLQAAQDNLQAAGGDQSTVQENISLSSDWVNAVKEQLNSNSSTLQVDPNSNFGQELSNYGSPLLTQNQYISDPALQKITVTLTTDGVLDPATELEVTRYTISLLNPIRQQLGVDEYQITQQALNDSTNIAKQYVAANWTLFNHGSHDFQVLFNNHQDGESLSDGYMYFDINNQASLDDIHRAIYNSICSMLFYDADSYWGHMTDLAGIRGWNNGIYLGVQLDKNGQIHFNGNMVKSEGGSYATQIDKSGQMKWYTGHPDTSARISLTANDSPETQQLKQAVQDARSQLDQANYKLNNDNQALDKANSDLQQAQQELQQAKDALAAANQTGWEIENGNKYYRDSNGNRITGWLYEDSNRYYFSPITGAAVTGLQNIDGHDYYFDQSTAAAQTGWESINGDGYYFDQKNYFAVSGLYKINNYLYYFNPYNFIQQMYWQNIDSNTYYFDPFALNGLQNIDGNIYYFDNYKMVTNQTLTLPDQNGVTGGTYIFDGNGVGTLKPAIQTGWQTENGNKYYRDSNGNLVDGWQKIDSQWHYFNNYILVTHQILNLPNNSEMSSGIYDFNDEGNYVVYSFDHDSSNNYYYFGGDGRAVTGLQRIWNDLYYFDPSTAIEYKGWKLINGDYYFFNPSAVDGLQDIGGSIYYFKDNKLITNQTLNLPSSNGIKGGTYKFDKNGHGNIVSQTGWKLINNSWEYLDENGNPVNDWQYIGGEWYFFNKNIMVANTVWNVPAKNGFAEGLYYFDESGHYLTNSWRKVSMNTTYYFDSDGRAVTSWQKIGDKWYYFNNHCLVMNQIFTVPTSNGVTGGTYYFDKGGHYLINTWQKDSQTMYHYFGKDGREQK